MRNFAAHQYDDLDPGRVWRTVTRDVPALRTYLVDVVLHFEGERSSRLRMVRAVKNRFGPVDEVGGFDLGSDGIVAVTDPTGAVR